MIADARERSRALDPERSFIVQAPAGSGKTELLVRRYIRLLQAVPSPEEVLALTFTRKAAAEMRQRALLAIPGGQSLGPRLRIQTIDAFCASLTRQLPVLSRFGATPRLVEDARPHYRESATRVLSELSPAAAVLLAHLDNNVAAAVSLLASMLARRDQWLARTGALPSRAELEANLLAERERLIAAARLLEPRASEAFAQEVLTKEGAWRRRSASAQALADNEPLRLALCRLLALPPANYSDYQWEVLAAIFELLPLAAAHLKVVFGERGEADFTEVAQGALRALGTPEAPTDLLLAFDQRIRHILIDEFQDTSRTQWELLERLTAGWTPGDGRTVFLVGDPMQSIYRFREAEVALFLRAQDAGLANVALESIRLSTNFRSQARLVAWFNESFARILPASADPGRGAVPHTPAVAHPRNPPLAGSAVSWHAVPDRDREAARVVALVKEAQGRTAILVRSREALAEIVPALRRAEIRFRAIEIEHLGEKQVVQDLYALTRALIHPADRIAWLSILRAPWCGMTLADLHALATGDEEALLFERLQDLSGLSEHGALLAGRLRDALAPALAARCRGTLRDRVEGVWLALGGPACVETANDLEDAEAYLDTLEALEHAGEIADPAQLQAALGELYALPDLAATKDDLQVMTIHKAKGLEFDTVIVPGLERGPGRADPPLFLWKQHADGSLLLAPIKETGAADDPAYRYLRDLQAEADHLEAGRLLYVAATRASERLHLIACLKQEPDGKVCVPHSRSLLALAWPVAEEAYSRLVPQQLVLDFMREPRQRLASLRRLEVDPSRIAPPSPVRWAPPQEEAAALQVEFSWAGETARHVGTVAHRWLQRMAGDALAGWDRARIEGLREAFRRELACCGVQASELAAGVETVATALKNALADERGRWVLGPHAEALTEHRIRILTGQGARTYVVDRVFRDGNGERWVIDYKTSRHEGAGLEAFLDRERERYEPQLHQYLLALQGTRAGLYFPLLRGWRAWARQ